MKYFLLLLLLPVAGLHAQDTIRNKADLAKYTTLVKYVGMDSVFFQFNGMIHKIDTTFVYGDWTEEGWKETWMTIAEIYERDTVQNDCLIAGVGHYGKIDSTVFNNYVHISLLKNEMLSIRYCDFLSHVLFDVKEPISSFTICGSTFKSLFEANIANADTLNFESTTFEKRVSLDSCRTKVINFVNTKFGEEFVLNCLDPGIKGRIQIMVSNPDPEKLKIDFSKYKFAHRVGAGYDEISSPFLRYLEYLRGKGELENYRQLDLDFQDFKYFQQHNIFLKALGYIQKYWWNFGYSKHYIFYWLFGSLFFLSIVNVRMVYKLNTDVYELENLSTFIRSSAVRYRRSLIVHWYVSFMYTAIIFLSLNVKMDRIKFEHTGLLLYFFFIYLFGIVCLAYLANYILKAGL